MNTRLKVGRRAFRSITMDRCPSSEKLRLMRFLEELRDLLAKWNQSSVETDEASILQDWLRDTTSRSKL